MLLFDTHAHLENEQIEPFLDDILAKTNAGELCVTAIGTDVPTSFRCLELARVWTSTGMTALLKSS